MVYELRSYEIDPDRFDEYLAWADSHTFPLSETLNFRLVGIWRPVAKAGEMAPTTNIPNILVWESEAEMRERWAAFLDSAAWHVAWAEALDPATGKSKYHRKVSRRSC